MRPAPSCAAFSAVATRSELAIPARRHGGEREAGIRRGQRASSRAVPAALGGQAMSRRGSPPASEAACGFHPEEAWRRAGGTRMPPAQGGPGSTRRRAADEGWEPGRPVNCSRT